MVADSEAPRDGRFVELLGHYYPRGKGGQIELDKAKVLDPAGQEIGEVNYYRDSGKLKVKNKAGKEVYSSQSGRMSPAFGIALMGGVPEGHRLIVMAELIARGI